MSSRLVKEKVKARMMQHIAQLWGADDVDIETAFDPLVAMLIEVCANEIEKVNNEIENTHTTLINHLAQLITPDILTGYKPAHAIIHASPAETKCVAKRETQFYFLKDTQSDKNLKDNNITEIYFSPVNNYRLTGAEVKYLAFDDSIYENVNAYQKKIIIEAERNKKLVYGNLWIGLELKNVDKEIPDVAFYFDLKNNPSKNAFIHLLPYTKWSLGELPLKIVSGILTNEENKNLLETEFDFDYIISNEINDLYNQQFLTVCNISTLNTKLPAVFETTFAKKDIAKLSSKCVWLCVEFPASVTPDMLRDIVCDVNCFPVVNKKLNEFTFRLSQNLNIVPLTTDNYFFSVKSVSSQEGIAYNSSIFSARSPGEGSYIIRQGNIGKFDSRNATELINYLTGLLRDEIGAFNAMGTEFISSSLKTLNQTLALIEQRIDNKGDKREPTKYLFINPKNEDDNLFVSFWTTNGELANNIKAGSKLELQGGNELRSETIMLLTATKGGKSKLDHVERLAAFKKSLLSRNRIVSIEDIKAFCIYELGRDLEDIKIKKGFIVSQHTKTGFIRTLDVSLKISKKNQSTSNDWEDVCADMEKKIMKNSSGLMPVRVFVE